LERLNWDAAWLTVIVAAVSAGDVAGGALERGAADVDDGVGHGRAGLVDHHAAHLARGRGLGARRGRDQGHGAEPDHAEHERLERPPAQPHPIARHPRRASHDHRLPHQRADSHRVSPLQSSEHTCHRRQRCDRINNEAVAGGRPRHN
jgi:hypothetical protein